MHDLAILGRITVDTFFAPDGQVHDRLLGGGLVYSAAGARLWTDSILLIGRFSLGLRPSPIGLLSSGGYHCAFLNPVDEELPHDVFFAYESLTRRVDGPPARHYLQTQLELPKRYLTEPSPRQAEVDRTELDPKAEDLPDLSARPRAAHFASPGWRSAALTIPLLREQGVRKVTYDPSSPDMRDPQSDHLQIVLSQVDVFMPSLRQAEEYFRPDPLTVPEMAEALSASGPEVVVIKLGENGCHLFDSSERAHWRIPAYPAHPVDLTGAGHAFCGGFIAGQVANHDPLEAALRASVSASIAIEGIGFDFPADAHPRLGEARLMALRQKCWRM